jgi:hypothetical protein
MLNQVEFEGYLTRSWEYRDGRFLRLANHRPGENGKAFSDYVTVQVDPALDLGTRRVKIGQLVRVAGRIVGRDIVEPLRLVVSKSHAGVELPGELGKLIIRRPTVQILATQVKFLADAKRPKKARAVKDMKSETESEASTAGVQSEPDPAELAETAT